MSITLTPEQAAFAGCERRFVVGLAGPGSGKTTTIGELVSGMTDQAAQTTVVLSFTRESANRLKSKMSGKQLFFVGTVHAFCRELLIQGGATIGLPTDLAPCDEDASRELQSDLAEKLKIDEDVKDLAEACYYNPVALPDRFPQKFSQAAKRFAMTYHKTLLDRRQLDFDAMLTWGIKLLQSGYQHGITQLIVDEVQDSSAFEWLVYSGLKTHRVWMVGDLDQAIYEWRRAAPEKLLDFCRNKAVEVFQIKHNYRSGPAICAAATRLIGHNKSRIDKAVVPADPAKSSRAVVNCYRTQAHEMAALVEWAKIDADRAVILRSNAGVAAVRKALVAADIKPVGTAEKPKDFNVHIALVALIANPQNNEVVNTWAIRRLGSARAKKLRLESESTSRPLIDLVLANPDFEWLSSLIDGARSEPVEDIVEECVSDASEATRELLLSCADGAKRMSDVVVAASEVMAESKKDGVWVGTIHRAKGLEWGSVWLPRWNAGIFPMRTPATEEERRLAFVSITRAINDVTISWADEIEDQWKPGSTRQGFPSLFIGETGLGGVR